MFVRRALLYITSTAASHLFGLCLLGMTTDHKILSSIELWIDASPPPFQTPFTDLMALEQIDVASLLRRSVLIYRFVDFRLLTMLVFHLSPNC